MRIETRLSRGLDLRRHDAPKARSTSRRRSRRSFAAADSRQQFPGRRISRRRSLRSWRFPAGGKRSIAARESWDLLAPASTANWALRKFAMAIRRRIGPAAQGDRARARQRGASRSADRSVRLAEPASETRHSRRKRNSRKRTPPKQTILRAASIHAQLQDLHARRNSSRMSLSRFPDSEKLRKRSRRLSRSTPNRSALRGRQYPLYVKDQFPVQALRRPAKARSREPIG